MKLSNLRVIIGLGNPGPMYLKHRHNIGFRVIDALAAEHSAPWRLADQMAVAEIMLGESRLLLVKPQTGMNLSGRVCGALRKQGIGAEHILVVHDELELPFGKIMIRHGGSARGHNGLRSLIETCGSDFYRLRFGVGRPERREDVPRYVLSNFSEGEDAVQEQIEHAIAELKASIP